MEKSRLNAYLNLIRKLLTCPHGEEWIYLKQNEELVNAEFLQFMEQVAIQIGHEGDLSTATFLHNWAAKLHHILIKEIKPIEPEEDKSEAYLDLIDQLLSFPEDMQEQLLIAHETLIGPGLVQALRNVSKQLRRRDENKAAEYLESIATELGQSWLEEYDVPSPLLKNPKLSKDRTSAPYSHAYDIARTNPEAVASSAAAIPMTTFVPQTAASAQTTTLLNDETDDLWFSPSKAATLPTTLPTAAPAPSKPLLSNSEPTPMPQNDRLNHPPTHEKVVDAVAGASFAEAASPTFGGPSGAQAIADGLNAIAQALQQLNQTLSIQKSSAEKQHPLQHLELLEQACQAEWQLTTEEIEQLLGVKPKCHGHDATYHRGEWCFTKIGKLGNQTAWRVSKAIM
mgnify:FL=1